MTPEQIDAYNTRTATQAALTKLSERISRLEGAPQSPTIDRALIEARRRRSALTLALSQLTEQAE